jgi:putative N6-adenine-specific DNA methylase
MNHFFLVVAPGFESLAVEELNIKIPGLKILNVEKGGVLVETSMDVGVLFNLVLKIPTTVLLRIAEFKCRDFPKLYQKVSNIRWAKYLVGSEFNLSVASSKSRLLHEKKIEKAVKEGIERHFEKQPPKKVNTPFAFEVNVRFFDDICTISLNLSGEPLFKRGYKKQSAKAPIRENLAAALYFSLQREFRNIDTLFDPMCGTGSLLLEAQYFWRQSQQREFAFQKKEDWLPAKISISDELATIKNFYGFDVDSKSIQDTKQSLGKVKDNWSLEVKDILKDKPSDLLGDVTVFITNPPYGERLKLPSKPQVYYKELLQCILAYKPAGGGIILPKMYSQFVPVVFSGYRAVQEIEFENGGIPVVFRIYKKA